MEPPWVGSQEHSVLSYRAAAALLRSFPEIPQEPLNLVLFPYIKLNQQLPSAELLKKTKSPDLNWSGSLIHIPLATVLH